MRTRGSSKARNMGESDQEDDGTGDLSRFLTQVDEIGKAKHYIYLDSRPFFAS